MTANYLRNLYLRANAMNDGNIIASLKAIGPGEALMDVGCWDAENTLRWKDAAQAKRVYGLEPVEKAARVAATKIDQVLIMSADREEWPLRPGSIEILVSNQVVEHLQDVDFFLSECGRVIRGGGYMVLSTNNLSSWHNLLALTLGMAPFDLTNSSKRKLGLGNPFALHRGEQDPRGESWTHKCIYTARWLGEWGAIYGFRLEKIYGAGYYPLPAFVARIDPMHSAFITLVYRKEG